EAKGKSLDYVEFFTMGEYHCIDVAFEDKTAMQFVIEPTFTLETELRRLEDRQLASPQEMAAHPQPIQPAITYPGPSLLRQVVGQFKTTDPLPIRRPFLPAWRKIDYLSESHSPAQEPLAP
ncbi:MAG TPA: hypothetical protein VH724_12830, partial [Candidatus Angelobacter sp.]|nr:hypothetical protein [Candidatus Angelobacter sp.]